MYFIDARYDVMYFWSFVRQVLFAIVVGATSSKGVLVMFLWTFWIFEVT